MGKPYRIFAEVVEGKALSQFYDAMKMDFAVQGALMPDTHAGYSLPIGAVVATEEVVIPAWVGYDIGCGMCALPLPFDAQAVRANANAIFEALYQRIPTGFNINEASRPSVTETALSLSDLSQEGRGIAEAKKWEQARGSLGSGNHFIELGQDEQGVLWAVIHSGSRGVGHGLAQHYMTLASPNRKASEGHFPLRVDSAEGQAYINDMNWALQYALENRREMMARILQVCTSVLGSSGQAHFAQLINRNHNHAELKDGLWIHRKGATHAEEGMMGVIPGNMRDGSFVVRGKGNPASLWSSSHGAGRVLGRREAKEKLSFQEFEQTMAEAGIVARVDNGTLDESPFAYKSIFEVMELQRDLVDVVAHIRPILNIKG